MLVEIMIEPTYPALPKAGESQFRIFNGRNCNYNIGIGQGITNFDLLPGHFHMEHVTVPSDTLPITITATTSSAGCSGFTESVRLESKTANSFFLTSQGGNSIIRPYEDDPDKSRQGRPIVRVLSNFLSNKEITLKGKDNEYTVESAEQLSTVLAGEYQVLLNGVSINENSKVDLKLGGVYTFVIIEKSAGNYVRIFLNFLCYFNLFFFRFLKFPLLQTPTQ